MSSFRGVTLRSTLYEISLIYGLFPFPMRKITSWSCSSKVMRAVSIFVSFFTFCFVLTYIYNICFVTTNNILLQHLRVIITFAYYNVQRYTLYRASDKFYI